MPNFIYVIAASEQGPCKIGRSNDPDRRLKQFQTGHAEPLRIFYREKIGDETVHRMEQAIHETIGYKRLRGEWFNISTEDAIFEIQHGVIFHEDKLVEKTAAEVLAQYRSE